MLEESVGLWAEQHLHLINAHLCLAWPVPIGRQGAAESYWLRQEADQSYTSLDPASIALQMPFDGDECALLAIHIPLKSGSLDLFGMGTEEIHEDEEIDRLVYRTFPLRYVLRGDLPALTEGQPLLKAASTWWANVNITYKIFQGPRRRGRPPGTG